ncbi:MAG TPA: sigma 54-interacting transcriptional regulator [Edaphobacter sp.]|nr:sigma 54-interacting transcriptional regulator [Edaphobacter sp.]
MSISPAASSCLAFTSPVAAALHPAGSDEFGMMGSSAAIRRLRLQVQRIGPHFRTVLVKGETGTEKELVARALHDRSRDGKVPFLSCRAAIFEGDLAELDQNAGLNDAVHRLAERSQRATLFLDEIGEMPLKAQGRLLNLLKQHDSAPNRVDVPKRMEQRIDLRVIASTSQDLRIPVSIGRFRHELYQRLATVEITVPPLRERIDDLDELVQYFLGRFALLYDRRFSDIPEDAMEQMRRCRWPGNMRELESVLRDGVLQSNGGLLQLHMPMLTGQEKPELPAPGANESVKLQDVLEQHVIRVLKDCKGNKLRAAEMLGISRSTLYRVLDTGASGK